MNDINVDAMHDACNLAKSEADIEIKQMKSEIDAIREESEVAGIVKAANCQSAYSEFVKYAALYNLKQSKGYKKKGMTWVEYCEYIGESRRTVDKILDDIGPITEAFSANLARLLGLPFNKIRMLGQTVGASLAKLAGNELIIDGVIVSLDPDNKEEIEAAIDTLIETHKQEKKDLKKDLANHKKQTDKIVEEETRGLKTEVGALIKEVDRLKPFDPTEKDRDWSIDQMKKIRLSSDSLVAACRLFVLDERIDDDFKLQAEVEQHMTEAELGLQDLRRLWTDRFYSEE